MLEGIASLIINATDKCLTWTLYGWITMVTECLGATETHKELEMDIYRSLNSKFFHNQHCHDNLDFARDVSTWAPSHYPDTCRPHGNLRSDHGLFRGLMLAGTGRSVCAISLTCLPSISGDSVIYVTDWSLWQDLPTLTTYCSIWTHCDSLIHFHNLTYTYGFFFVFFI